MATGPMSGIKVIEYCDFISGPYCTKLLADLGAEVIKVEPLNGDSARKRGPFLNNLPNPETSGVFLYTNTNKKGITLNLETPRGQQLFRELLKDADLLVEDRKPEQMKAWGLDYASLRQVNPGLIMLSLTEFGESGPYKDYKAYYMNTYHASGAGFVLPAASPNADREPIKGGGYVGEYDIGMYCAVAAAAAAFNKLLTGKGQYIEVSRQEALMSLEGMGIVRYYTQGKSPSRVGKNRTRDTLLHCKDDGYIILIMYPQKQWDGLIKALGNPDWAKDEKFAVQKSRDANFAEIKNHLAEEAIKYDTMELFYKIQDAGSACAPILSAKQVYESPQFKERGFYEKIVHPVAGELEYPGLPFKFEDAAVDGNTGAPLLGQHNEEIFCGKLGCTREELVKMRTAGII